MYQACFVTLWKETGTSVSLFMLETLTAEEVVKHVV